MIVLDTSAVLALVDRDDAGHAACAAALGRARPPYVVPAGILAEVAYLIERKVGLAVLVAFVDDLAAHAFTLDCGAQDFARIAALVRRYADLRLGFADASVIACAERSDAPVLTLDRRDFSVVAREGTIRLALE